MGQATRAHVVKEILYQKPGQFAGIAPGIGLIRAEPVSLFQHVPGYAIMLLGAIQCVEARRLENRNPHLNQEQIEHYLFHFYGVEQVLWVEEGIVGDDTDGHIDDTVRFVNEDTVLAVIEENKKDENYELLQKNLKQLKQMRLIDGKQLNVVELPMPPEYLYEDQRLPCSYANFYIANHAVIVPTFRCDKDDHALDIIQSCFPTRKVVGIDSTEIIWGLGSFHCLSQQEPAV